MSKFAALAEEAAQHAPMSNGDIPTSPGRVLLADGDGLCYYCAGNDETAAGTARANMIDKLRSAARASGSESIRILLTGRGSHKGYRYAVARVKPYQGQRTGGNRPKNWAYLRELLEIGGDACLGPGMTVEVTNVAEADDLFARYANGNTVIYTQDKDMRMVPGWHLDWLTHVMFRLRSTDWSVMHNDKQFGRAWFWSQMLHGDDVDFIPGLPFYTTGERLKSGPKKGEIKEIRCGEKSEAVVKLLPEVSSDMGACILLQGLYQSCYGDRWLVEMLEQGILLWMRSDPVSDPFDVCQAGKPLHPLTTHALFDAAYAEIDGRIQEYIASAQTQDDGSGIDTGSDAGEAAAEMCSVSATVPPGSSSAGSRSLNGTCAGDLAPRLQCSGGEDSELVQEVRRTEPTGFPTWARRLLPKARD